MDFKTLEGKILANRSSIRQIRQCFPPPTFRAIRYSPLYYGLLLLLYQSVGYMSY